MYCQNCGRELNDNADVCLNCGKFVKENNQATTPTKSVSDTGSVGWGFLGFFFPMLGLILYLIWKDTAPLNAKMSGKGALIGVIFQVVLIIAYFVFLLILMGASYNNLAVNSSVTM